MNRDMSENSGATCCFTGHRDIPPEIFSALGPRLRETVRALYDGGYTRFISGGARGFDTYAAAMVGTLKSELAGLTLTLAAPFRGHYSSWTIRDREMYKRLLLIADEEIVVSERYSRSVYYYRNRWMVDRADVCVACWSGSPGGTAQTVNEALKRGIEVINLWE